MYYCSCSNTDDLPQLVVVLGVGPALNGRRRARGRHFAGQRRVAKTRAPAALRRRSRRGRGGGRAAVRRARARAAAIGAALLLLLLLLLRLSTRAASAREFGSG